jgi:hypothetical protein
MADPTFCSVLRGGVTPVRLINFIRKKINEQMGPSMIDTGDSLTPVYHSDNGDRCPIGFLLSKKVMRELCTRNPTMDAHIDTLDRTVIHYVKQYHSITGPCLWVLIPIMAGLWKMAVTWATFDSSPVLLMRVS